MSLTPPYQPPTDGGEGTAPPRRRSNVGVWMGLGCLGVIVLSCVILTYWAQTFLPRMIFSQDEPVRRFGSTFALALTLGTIPETCTDGMPGEGAEHWLDPRMSAGDRRELCNVDQQTIEEIVSKDRVVVENLSEVAEADRGALPTVADPSLCYRYTTSRFRFTGCLDQDSKSKIPYKIVSAEEIAH